MSERIGLWIVGAHGGVATTVAVGLSALKKGSVGDGGLVSQLEPFRKLGLIDWSDIVLGGHEIRRTDSVTEAFHLSGATPAISRELIIQCESELLEFDRNVRPGVLYNVGDTITKLASDGFVDPDRTAGAAITRIQADLQAFADAHGLERLIVLNLA